MIAIAAIFGHLISCIPSTDGFTAAYTHSHSELHSCLRLCSSQQQKQHRDADTEEDRWCDEPSCVLKERNPYDVHVYYSTAEERKAAMELRTKMHQRFGDRMRFYPPKDRPIGPHPVPMWEADFGGYEHRHNRTMVRDFLRTHNPSELSVLVHPHSVDGDYADHTEHAFWAGEVLELRIRGWRR